MHGVGSEWGVLRWQVVEAASSFGTKTWLGECRVMDSRNAVAMCIDIEATICLVMRVKRDVSRMVDVSDEELVV